MKALTVRQPWAWAITNGLKDVENRTRRTTHRGLLAIHAGARWDGHDAHDAVAKLYGRHPVEVRITDSQMSAVVAVVDLYDVTNESTSPWAIPGRWHWLLRDIRPLAEPVPCAGTQGLWALSAEVEAAVRDQLSAVAR